MVAERYIGCAGWSIPKPHVHLFPASGTHLERYAARLRCVEINSSFYRPHRRATYERWRDATPTGFRFAIKMPKEMSHTRRLHDCQQLLSAFFEQIAGLADKLGPCLLQLPPSLALERDVAASFFTALRDRFGGNVVCEPRHGSWFGEAAGALLANYGVGRVAADPAIVPGAAEPGGSLDTVYYRLHGTPHMYYSAYDQSYLDQLAQRLQAPQTARVQWCIFDNTALGAAAQNALALMERMGR